MEVRNWARWVAVALVTAGCGGTNVDGLLDSGPRDVAIGGDVADAGSPPQDGATTDTGSDRRAHV